MYTYLPQEGNHLLTKLKQLFEPSEVEQRGETEHELESMNVAEKETGQRQGENEKEQEPIGQLSNRERPYRMHVEFFYYHPHASTDEQFSRRDLDHLPVMCVTVHFMEEDRRLPYYVPAMLNGLEDTLQAMKMQYLKVDRPQLYSIFVDTKRYPLQEVKKVIHVLVKQFTRLHEQNEETVTIRVHVGGDELYNDLLEAYEMNA